jgi:hypothetical protein
MPRLKRLGISSLLRLINREETEDDDIALLDYLALHAADHLTTIGCSGSCAAQALWADSRIRDRVPHRERSSCRDVVGSELHAGDPQLKLGLGIRWGREVSWLVHPSREAAYRICDQRARSVEKTERDAHRKADLKFIKHIGEHDWINPGQREGDAFCRDGAALFDGGD